MSGNGSPELYAALRRAGQHSPQVSGRRAKSPDRLFGFVTAGAVPSSAAPAFFFCTEGLKMKVTTCNDRPVQHVRYMPDGSVILKLYERQPTGRARHLRVSLAQWLAGRGVYLLESHASRRAQARQLARRRCG